MDYGTYQLLSTSHLMILPASRQATSRCWPAGQWAWLRAVHPMHRGLAGGPTPLLPHGHDERPLSPLSKKRSAWQWNQQRTSPCHVTVARDNYLAGDQGVYSNVTICSYFNVPKKTTRPAQSSYLSVVVCTLLKALLLKHEGTSSACGACLAVSSSYELEVYLLESFQECKACRSNNYVAKTNDIPARARNKC